MATHILFVCTGNTCRSPLAEGLCRKMAKELGLDIEVRSAGVAAMDGVAVSRHSSDILQAKGASEGMTASQSVREDTVAWADLILTMTMSHKRSVIQRYPQAVDKVFTLKEYAEDNQQVLDQIREKEELMSDLQLKQALGQAVTPAERDRLLQLDRLTPDYDIMDPYGGSRRDYDDTAEEIAEALAKLLRKLKSGRI